VRKSNCDPSTIFWIHLPTIVVKLGPLNGMCCLTNELKNSFFTLSSHIVCNFMNICHTLAVRHQQHALFSQLSNNLIRSGETVSQPHFVSVETLEYSDAICSTLKISPHEDGAVAKVLCCNAVEYKVGNLLILSIDQQSGHPVFGCNRGFVSVPGNETWYVVTECVTTLHFVHRLHAY
jgi:hypothetical protein